MHEQMHALQRKLVNVVTENEAMRHVVDKLQCHVLGLRRQLHHAGLKPAVQLDEELLRPCPHKVCAVAGWVRSSEDCIMRCGRHLIRTKQQVPGSIKHDQQAW